MRRQLCPIGFSKGCEEASHRPLVLGTLLCLLYLAPSAHTHKRSSQLPHEWQLVQPAGSGPPDGRYLHSAVMVSRAHHCGPHASCPHEPFRSRQMDRIMVTYGGRTAQNFIWNDVWFLNTSSPDKLHPADWTWQSISTVTYDPEPPQGRFGHTATALAHSCLRWMSPNPGGGNTKPWQTMGMMIFGGSMQSSAGSASNPAPKERLSRELWTLTYWGFEDGFWVWDQVYPVRDAPWPSARAMHTATLTNTTLLVWGGRTDLPDDNLWALELGGIHTPYWHRIELDTKPTQRVGHTLTVFNESAMVMYGGAELNSSGEVERYIDEAWLLFVPGPSTCTRSVYAVAKSATCTGLGVNNCTADLGCAYQNKCFSICGIHQRADTCAAASPGCDYRPAGTYSWHRLVTTRSTPAGRAFHSAVWNHGALGADITFFGGGPNPSLWTMISDAKPLSLMAISETKPFPKAPTSC